MLDAASSNSRAVKGELPCMISQALERMDEEIRGAQSLLNTQSNGIEFLDKDRVLHQYGYAYGTLWRDGHPLVSGIEAFHFEYRDGRGSLYVRSNLHRDDVRLISYTLRISLGNDCMIRNKTVRVCPKDISPAPEQYKVVWAGLLG